MSKSIKLSPKHGVNPCIPLCVFCGQEKNEIALLGMLKDDKEAPMKAVINMEPCDQCKENWSRGVPLIRVTRQEPGNGMPPIQKDDNGGLWPTAQYTVMTAQAVKRIFGIDRKAGEPILMEDKAFDDIMEQAKAQGALPEEGENV